METGKPENLAFQIEEAKRSLEASIEQAVGRYEPGHGGAFSIDLDLKSTREDDEHAELRRDIRLLADAFHAHGAVRQAGVRASRVTAIDSDGDGEVAVKVKYDYPA